MNKSQNVVFLSLGTNLGNRSEHMRNMLCLVREALTGPLNHSPVMETAPVDVSSELPAFLNCVVSGYYNGTPRQLLTACMEIERKCGRFRGPEIISRTADVDILVFGSQIVHDDELDIPHPAIARRRFCVEGLAATAPEFIHPELQISFSTMAHEIPGTVRSQPVRSVGELEDPLLASCLSAFE